jgi:hypothetical protein
MNLKFIIDGYSRQIIEKISLILKDRASMQEKEEQPQ